MKMMMFLLVSALALLVCPAVANPANPAHHKPDYNLNHIIDLAKQYNKSIAKGLFVEDVSHLAEGSGRCEDKFFCKVHEILHKRKIEGEREILRNLEVFTSAKNLSCEEVLKEVKPTGVTIQMPELLKYLTICIRHRNFAGEKQGGKTSSQ